MLQCPKDKLCIKHPVRVESNATFIVHLSKLDHADDIKADDCGHWIHNGHKTTKVVVWKSGGKITHALSTSKNRKSTPDENSEMYTLASVYYNRDPHLHFKRTFYYLYGKLLHSIFFLLQKFKFT